MNDIEEKRELFHQQINAWVVRQGLFYQLFHSGSRRGFIEQLVALGVKVAAVALVLSIAVFIYLYTRVESDSFLTQAEESLVIALKADEAKVKGIKRKNGAVSIKSVILEGGENSFFHKCSARILELAEPPLIPLNDTWNVGSVKSSSLDVTLKAGDSDDIQAEQVYAELFSNESPLLFNQFESQDVTIRWGYSEQNSGLIENSKLSLRRENDEWLINIEGGTFQFGHFQPMEIRHMKVRCTADKVIIEDAQLDYGQGKLRYKTSVSVAGQPKLNGDFTLENMPIDILLNEDYEDLIEGTVTGSGEISGSTNTKDGVILDMNLMVTESDMLSLKGELPVVKALSVIDIYNNYRKINFDSGSFNFVIRGEKREFKNINLISKETFSLTGSYIVRPSSYEEIGLSLGIDDLKAVKDTLNDVFVFTNVNQTLLGGQVKDTLKDTLNDVVALDKKESEDAANTSFKITGDADLNARVSKEIDKLQRQSILKESEIPRFEGVLQMGVKAPAFLNKDRLKKAYPHDASVDWTWVEVPLSGKFNTLTQKTADKLYSLTDR